MEICPDTKAIEHPAFIDLIITLRKLEIRDKSFPDVITPEKRHAFKKFKIVERCVKAWAQKLLNTEQCRETIFIDCIRFY